MIEKVCLRLCGLFMLALLFTACQTAGSNPVTVDESDTGSVVSLKTDQDLFIRLESNITTGYRWTVAEGDETLLPMQGEPEYMMSSGDRDGAGAGGVEVFHFKPAKAGQVHLKLIYSRPWETGEEPAETYELDINIE